MLDLGSLWGWLANALFIVLGAPPDSLDAAQRQALLDRVRSGAVLVVSGAMEDSHLEESWLGNYLPVQIIGNRQMSEIRLTDGSALKLVATVPVCEAVAVADQGRDDSTEVVLADGHYVHAAIRHLGLGRIVFTSFPVGALDATDHRTRALWERLLGLDNQSPGGGFARTSAQRHQAMQQLLGSPAPTWKIAAWVVGGYALLVMAAHLLSIGNANGPRAFIMISVVAVFSCGALVSITELRHHDDPISGARLGEIDLGADGMGRIKEEYAFYGRNIATFQLKSADWKVVGQPIDFDPNDAPTVIDQPFNAIDAGVHAEGIRRIWQATSVYSDRPTLVVSGQFGPRGLTVTSSSSFASAIKSPLLIWSSSLLRMPSIPPGQGAVAITAADLNPAGVFTHGSGVVGQMDRLRGLLVQNIQGSIQNSADLELPRERFIAGWLDLADVPPMLSDTNASSPVMNGQIMLRAPIVIKPSAIGSMVRVEGSFNQLDRLPDTALFPIDANGSATANRPGDWVIVVKSPWEIGKLKPTRAALSVDLDTPRHTVTVQASQFTHPQGARFSGDSSTAPLATWKQVVGHREKSFDVSNSDISPEGYLVLRVAVDLPDEESNQANPVPWAMRNVQLSLEAQVVGKAVKPVIVVADVSDDAPPQPVIRKISPVKKGH